MALKGSQGKFSGIITPVICGSSANIEIIVEPVTVAPGIQVQIFNIIGSIGQG
jgi:hypothetical protein